MGRYIKSIASNRETVKRVLVLFVAIIAFSGVLVFALEGYDEPDYYYEGLNDYDENDEPSYVGDGPDNLGITSWEELRDAVAQGVTSIVLGDDIFSEDHYAVVISAGMDVEIYGNGFTLFQETENQRHFIIEAGGILRLSRVVLSGSLVDVDFNHGGIAVHGGSLYLGRDSFISNNRAYYGGGVYMRGGTLAIEFYSYINHNNATNGGGVYILDGGHVVMQAGSISDNHASERGGGIMGRSGALIELSGGVIENNRANINGGGLFVLDASSRFDMTGGLVARNYAHNGAGVWFGSGARFEMVSGYIEANRAFGFGGGVFISDGVFAMDGGRIRNSNSATIGGGGVHMVLGTFLMNNSALVYGNRAEAGASGGGVSVVGGNFYMNNQALIDWNLAGGNGSGLYIAGAGRGTISGSAAIQGAAVHLEGMAELTMMGEARVSDNTFDNVDNPTRYHGSAVSMTGNARFYMTEDSIIHDNASRGVAMFGSAFFEMRDRAAIARNTAAGNGGGVMVLGGVFVIRDNARIIGNSAGHNHEGLGGGVHVAGINSELQMLGGTIGGIGREERNIAASGGGVSVVAGAWFDMQAGARIIGNFAQSHDGGGVFVEGSSLFTMEGGSVGGSAAAERNSAIHGIGGGVRVHNEATFLMTGGVIHNNVALRGGGAAVGANMTMMGNAGIIENRATLFGGGVYVLAQGEFIMGGDVSEIRGNFTTSMAYGELTAGGGVSVTGGSSFILNSGNIQDNHAQNGGGVHIADGSIVTMTGGNISNNYTRTANEHSEGFTGGNGGGVIAEGDSTFDMKGGRINGNIATGSGGGVYVYESIFNMAADIDWETFDISIPVIENNTAAISGGGVAVYGDSASFDMWGSIVEGNGHPLGHPDPALGSIFHGATTIVGISPRYGGGVRIAYGAEFTLREESLIRRNVALYGGGVNISYENASFLMTGGVIGGSRELNHGNTATGSGGGLFVGQDARFSIILSAASVLSNEDEIIIQIPNGSIAGNTASGIGSETIDGGGGGVYVAKSGMFNAEGGYITGNHAPNGLGGGIFTEAYDYSDPLLEGWAYGNLSLSDVTFGDNSALSSFIPPRNVAALSHIGFNSTSQPSGTPVSNIHPINNLDINFWYRSVQFNFFTTDYELFMNPRVVNLLNSAQFRLFRVVDAYLDLPTSGDGLVILDDEGMLNDPRFVEVSFVGGNFTSSQARYLSFIMDPRGVYQLVTVAAPMGFDLPAGQWRITYNRDDDRFNTPTIIGGIPMPGIMSSTSIPLEEIPAFAPEGEHWYVINMQPLELPYAGGYGSLMYNVAGMVIMGFAAVVLGIVAGEKWRQMQMKRV